MKKILLIISILVLSVACGVVGNALANSAATLPMAQVTGIPAAEPSSQPAVEPFSQPDVSAASTPAAGGEGDYELYADNALYGRYPTLEEAVRQGESLKNAAVRQKGKTRWLWSNYPPFSVYTDDISHTDFATFAEAVSFARGVPRSLIYFRPNSSLIWQNRIGLHGSAWMENVPVILQMPELFRGCEVTSLAMLLQYKSVAVDKMTLAEAIDKDPTPYSRGKNGVTAGNPHVGFVGDIADKSKFGLGVYHEPICRLMAAYLPDSALDLTGCEFGDLFGFLESNIPVWVIVTSSFAPLPDSAFETWHTAQGDIRVTYNEHSVLVTGYDDQQIYFNDPLSGPGRAGRAGFIAAWEQMGRQAVSNSW